MRMALGGIVVIGYAIVTRTSLRPSRRELRPLAGLGVLFVVQTTLMYVGGDHTTAGHASVLIFTFPLWTSIFGHFFVPGDRMSRGRTGGLLIAYGGVVVVFAGGLGGRRQSGRRPDDDFVGHAVGRTANLSVALFAGDRRAAPADDAVGGVGLRVRLGRRLPGVGRRDLVLGVRGGAALSGAS